MNNKSNLHNDNSQLILYISRPIPSTVVDTLHLLFVSPSPKPFSYTMSTLLPQGWRNQLGGTVLLLGSLLLGANAAQAQVDTYQFAASSGTFTPLVGGTNVSSIQADDVLSSPISLPFSFTFDGAVQTQVLASSNGWLTFNPAATSNDLDMGPADERPLIAPYWDDMHGGAGTASYQTTGTAPNRVFTFEWLNWYRYGGSSPEISFQVKLYETTNVVRIIYRQESSTISNPAASIGLSGTGTGSGSFLSVSDAVANPSVSSTTENDLISTAPPTGQVYQFTPPVPSACPTPRNLSATVTTTTATLTWTVSNASPGPFTVLYGPTGFNPATGGTPITGITGTSQTINGLQPGTAYQFYVTQNCGGAAGNSNLSNAASFSTNALPPANDDCAGAINVPIQYGTTCISQVSADNSAATASMGVPPPGCASYQDGDIWFKVTVPVSGSVTVQTVPPTGSSNITDTGLAVYSGTCGALVLEDCDDDGSPTGAYSLIDLTGRTPGEVLYIRAWAYGGNNTGLIAVCVTSPSNCPLATGLTATNLTNTTADLNWTAGGPVGTGDTFEIEYGASGFMPGSGTAVTGLTGTSFSLTGLQPSTNYCFYVRQNCGPTNGSSTYAGPFCFTTPLTAPLNDEPCGALPLSSAAPVSGTNSGATTSLQNGIVLPACSPSAAPKDVWFTMTPTGSSTTLTITGNPAGMVRIYESPDCSNGPFNLMSCHAGAGNNQPVGTINLTGLTPGQRYYVAVSGYGSSDTPGSFTVAGTALSSRVQAERSALLVYPNPSSSGQLTLRLEAGHAAGQATLLNALGQTVRTASLGTAAEHTISTQGLPAGVYTLLVKTGQDTFSRK